MIGENEESPSGGSLDLGSKNAIGDVGVSVEEVRTRNADIVEVELGVIDSVETDFVTHIVNRHARTDGQVFVSMHTVK